jgi:hypothetical protein
LRITCRPVEGWDAKKEVPGKLDEYACLAYRATPAWAHRFRRWQVRGGLMSVSTRVCVGARTRFAQFKAKIPRQGTGCSTAYGADRRWLRQRAMTGVSVLWTPMWTASTTRPECPHISCRPAYDQQEWSHRGQSVHTFLADRAARFSHFLPTSGPSKAQVATHTLPTDAHTVPTRSPHICRSEHGFEVGL